MSETVNTFSLIGDKFMPEIYLKQSGFTYSVCGQNKKKKSNIYAKMKYRLYLYGVM